MQSHKLVEHKILKRKVKRIESAEEIKFKDLQSIKQRLDKLEAKIEKLERLYDTRTHILIDRPAVRIDYTKYLELYESLEFKNVNHKKTHAFMLWLFLYQNGYYLREIGAMFNRDHSTIIHGRNTAMNNILAMPEAYESECKFYNDLLNLKKEQNDTQH